MKLTPAEFDALVSKVARRFADVLPGSAEGDWRYKAMLTEIKDYSPATLNAMFAMPAVPQYYWNAEALMGGDHSEGVLNDYANLCTAFEESAFDEDEDRLIQGVYSLKKYDDVAHQGAGFERSEDRVNQCEAILKIVRFSISPPEYDEGFEDLVEYEPYPYMGTTLPLLVDAGMLQLITGKKYEPATVAEIVVQRQIADADIVEELLQSSHGALLQGSL